MANTNIHYLERAMLGCDLDGGRTAVRLLEEGQADHDDCVTIFCDRDMAKRIYKAINGKPPICIVHRAEAPMGSHCVDVYEREADKPCVTLACDSDMAQAVVDAINYPHGSYDDAEDDK